MVQRIDSVLYNDLLSYSAPDYKGFTAIAVYTTLKKFRNRVHSYQPEDNIRGYKLLKVHTGISEQILRFYIPVFIEMELCNFLDNGGFFMKGNQKTKSLKKKLVPIKIFEKLTQTKTAVKYVIEHSNLVSQKKTLIKKKRQSEILKASGNNSISNLGQLKQLRALQKRGISCQDDLNLVKTITLSNRRIGELISGGDCPYNQKSRGHYIKKKFRAMGLHDYKRRFEKISNKKFTFDQYLGMRYGLRETYGNVTWINGKVYTELSSELWDISDTQSIPQMKERYKAPTKTIVPMEDIEDYKRLREPNGELHPWLIQSQYLTTQDNLPLVGEKKNN